ncbi:hypothetical protein C482_01685 [Natrialba chahannaoensis JCM 10990]|uniref:Uncharacterized protein n=2 Tax=Natrialba chahannaoensis TaxID=68911 RepID=M0BA28_9EURY|nr:hypothetical protein C482_01685 [Natrialba chahannaoensis JCM 10990]
MLLLAGCSSSFLSDDSPDGEELANSAGTDIGQAEIGESMLFEMRMTEANHYDLVQEQPPFMLDNSLERQNLIQRYQYLNDQNNVHHVYMLSHDGKVINYELAQGKVSSINSKLTNDRQIVKAPDCRFRSGSGAGSNGACHKVVESPQMDGSYGENGDAIFFFTTDGQYVEWNGLYVVSEEPKGITTEVTLVEEISEDGPVQENPESNEEVIDGDSDTDAADFQDNEDEESNE